MSNIVVRGITGFFFVLIIILVTIFGDWYFYTLFGLVSIVSLNEFYHLFNKTENSPNISQGLILGSLLYIIGIYSITNIELNIYFIALIILIFPLIAFAELFRAKKTPFFNMGITFIGIIYIITPFLIINLLRLNQTDYWLVLSIFLLTWTSDTFAYLVGRKIGKHKLFERLSPKKSWEGFIGGFLATIFVGFLIAYLTEDNMIKFMIYGAIISVFGTLGDLVESMLKRSLKIKDTGNILPGHGGLLDRFDAIIFVIPIIYSIEILCF